MTSSDAPADAVKKTPIDAISPWEAAALGAVFLWYFPAALKLAGAAFVDLRYQAVTPPPQYSVTTILVTAGALLLFFAVEMLFLKRSCNAAGKTFIIANLPLVPAAWLWFFPASFPAMAVILLAAVWATARVCSAVSVPVLPELSGRKSILVLLAALTVFAVYGTVQQTDSFNKLAMQWLDWGHFYEMLNNFRSGRPFHLNLCHGNFLGSRFSPALIVLLPVVLTGNIPLFFFCGSLFVASGAIFVWLIARELKFSAAEALLWGMWYLTIPGIVNMNLPLLDGFHEIFLLFPLSLAAWWLYLKQKYLWVVVLMLISFCVRETATFMYIGWGAVLFFSGKRKTGIAVALFSAAATALIIGVLMPSFRPPVSGSYDHTVFFPHLGNSVTDIALSPFLKPEAFWGTLFSRHNLLYWLTLFLPFAPAAARPLLLLPMLPDLIMVSVDSRFDSQTVLRHYQAVMIITAVIATLEGTAKLKRSSVVPKYLRPLFAGLPGKPAIGRGMTGAAFAGAVLGTVMLTQIPGLPASDPRLPEWSDARPVMERFKEHIPAGANVTAGPRIASMLVGHCEIFFDYLCDEEKLQEYVFIENFSPMYNEDKLSRYLLRHPRWQLLHQEYLDERSLQLFRRVPGGNAVKAPSPLTVIPEEEWQKIGHPIPSPAAGVELRGVPAPGKGRIIILARLTEKRSGDLGFTVTLTRNDGSRSRYFSSFGRTVVPADMARPGEVYIFDVPFSGSVTGCKVDITVIR